MDSKQVIELKKFAAEIRITVLKMLANLGSGHVGGSLSICDVLAVLYGTEMAYDPGDPQWEGRDYLVMSKGHCGPALYAALALKGFFPMEELSTLNKIGTILPSHCDRRKTPGIDMSTGSLGQGVSCALGIALGLMLDGKDNYVYAIIGDGESQEGQVWETLMLGPNKKVRNLIVFLDYNLQQLDGYIDDINGLGDMKTKAELFGWCGVSCDGHDPEAVGNAIKICKASGKPGFIVLNTVKGKGWKEIEGDAGNHHMKGLDKEMIASSAAMLYEEIEAYERQLIEDGDV